LSRRVRRILRIRSFKILSVIWLPISYQFDE
jgi:hypothetical protein